MSAEQDPWSEAGLAQAREVDAFRPQADPEAWAAAVRALGDATEAVREVARHALAGAQDRLDAMEPQHVVTLVAHLQDLRRDLQGMEADLARLLGRDDTADRAGVLPDGRSWQVRKGAVRKAWRHAEWQHDVRALVLARLAEDGDVGGALATLQGVHGSTAPRATALRALGLDPDEYAESVPGSWGVQVDPRAD